MEKVYTLQKPSLKYKKEIFENKRSYTEYIALITLLFFTGSYLNNFIILTCFHIDISNYFDAKDYITSSATTLGLLILSIVLSITLFYIEFKMSVKLFQNNNESTLFRKILGVLVLIILFFTTNINAIIMTIVLLFSGLIIWLVTQIKNQKISLIIFLITMFYLQIFTASAVEVANIYKHKKEIYFYLDKNEDVDINSKKFIKSISKYTFFYDEQNKKTIVIPNSDIIRIEQHYKVNTRYRIHDVFDKYLKKIQSTFNSSQ